ncbi:heavy metal-associated isoprenylated plant protein 46-like [Vicia villosa]|uniref:heavy metal-associated isoprenylated plant protein 46-like n=1 Tax=Vicia villosa TaxID=3911 RepID=UPI00273C6848|nr:heavy metal-associated isoprenylated plant protein 46-like [Vicia villosa]
MAKQKVVINVTMKNQKARSSAMKIAVGVREVESAAIKGDSKDQIEVTGEGIDSVKLTRLLRKKFGYANLVSVGDVEKKEEKKEEAIVVWPNSVPVPHCNCSFVRYYEDPYNCSIM